MPDDEGGYLVPADIRPAIERFMFATLIRKSKHPWAKLVCSATSLPKFSDPPFIIYRWALDSST